MCPVGGTSFIEWGGVGTEVPLRPRKTPLVQAWGKHSFLSALVTPLAFDSADILCAFHFLSFILISSILTSWSRSLKVGQQIWEKGLHQDPRWDYCHSLGGKEQPWCRFGIVRTSKRRRYKRATPDSHLQEVFPTTENLTCLSLQNCLGEERKTGSPPLVRDSMAHQRKAWTRRTNMARFQVPLATCLAWCDQCGSYSLGHLRGHHPNHQYFISSVLKSKLH